MDKKQFKEFCKKEFEARGFKKQNNAFYLAGQDLLCGIDMLKYYNIIKSKTYNYLENLTEDVERDC